MVWWGGHYRAVSANHAVNMGTTWLGTFHVAHQPTSTRYLIPLHFFCVGTADHCRSSSASSAQFRASSSARKIVGPRLYVTSSKLQYCTVLYCNRHILSIGTSSMLPVQAYTLFSHTLPRLISSIIISRPSHHRMVYDRGMPSTTAALVPDGNPTQNAPFVALFFAQHPTCPLSTNSLCSASCLRTGICGYCGSTSGSTTVRCGPTTVRTTVKNLRSSGSPTPEQPVT
jgi:hypothetical protein